MQVSVLSLPVVSIGFILLLQVHQDAATFPLAIFSGAPAAGLAILSAEAVTALSGLAVLSKLGLVLKGAALGGALSRSHSVIHHHTGPLHHHHRVDISRRGKRSVLGEELEVDVALALMAEMEPEHCYKRIICAASTGQ